MARPLLWVRVGDAAAASGMIVTVVQWALVVGVATFGTLYLTLGGRLPARHGGEAFRLLSAHAMSVTCLGLAAAALAGAGLAVLRSLTARAGHRVQAGR